MCVSDSWRSPLQLTVPRVTPLDAGSRACPPLWNLLPFLALTESWVLSGLLTYVFPEEVCGSLPCGEIFCIISWWMIRELFFLYPYLEVMVYAFCYKLEIINNSWKKAELQYHCPVRCIMQTSSLRSKIFHMHQLFSMRLFSVLVWPSHPNAIPACNWVTVSGIFQNTLVIGLNEHFILCQASLQT